MREPSTPAAIVRAMLPFLISEATLDSALASLAEVDRDGFAPLFAISGRPALRTDRTGFEGLAATITAQQVSTANAAAIFGRLGAALAPLTTTAMLAASDEVLRRVGLSAAKVRTLRSVAATVEDGTLPLHRLGDMPAKAARRHLLAVTGIGPWTADVSSCFA